MTELEVVAELAYLIEGRSSDPDVVSLANLVKHLAEYLDGVDTTRHYARLERSARRD